MPGFGPLPSCVRHPLDERVKVIGEDQVAVLLLARFKLLRTERQGGQPLPSVKSFWPVQIVATKECLKI